MPGAVDSLETAPGLQPYKVVQGSLVRVHDSSLECATCFHLEGHYLPIGLMLSPRHGRNRTSMPSFIKPAFYLWRS